MMSSIEFFSKEIDEYQERIEALKSERDVAWKEAHESGMSWGAISKLSGVSAYTVQNRVERLSEEPRPTLQDDPCWAFPNPRKGYWDKGPSKQLIWRLQEYAMPRGYRRGRGSLCALRKWFRSRLASELLQLKLSKHDVETLGRWLEDPRGEE